jgi:hypothetical protein
MFWKRTRKLHNGGHFELSLLTKYPRMPEWHHSDSHSRHVEDSKTPIRHCLDDKARFGVWLPGFRTGSKWRKQADAEGFFKSLFLTLSFIILFYTFDMFNRKPMWVSGIKKTFCCNLFTVSPKYSVDWLDYILYMDFSFLLC